MGNSTPAIRLVALRRFYELAERLAARIGGPRVLGSCDGRMIWPQRGVYFFIEDGDDRSGSGSGPRFIRVGTHALRSGSRSTLWGRLSQHRGSVNGGNHRGSIFRLLVGLALIERTPGLALSSWGVGASAPKEVIDQERDLEAKVSDVLGRMRVLWLDIPDEPGPDSLRGFIERNAIALLSAYRSEAIDPASPNWLGRSCPRGKVRLSGLWNNNHVDEAVDPTFLDVFEHLIDGRTAAVGSTRSATASPSMAPSPVGGNADRILAALSRKPDLDDDQLSQEAGVAPRQQVNIICRRLEQAGRIKRFAGANGKIVSRVTGSAMAPGSTASLPLSGPFIDPRSAAGHARVGSHTILAPTPPIDIRAKDTLVILPCSGRKSPGGEGQGAVESILTDLPPELACRLQTARALLAVRARLDETKLLPAWRRYAGTLYQSAQPALLEWVTPAWARQLLVLSGGYGVLRAVDAIGEVDPVFGTV